MCIRKQIDFIDIEDNVYARDDLLEKYAKCSYSIPKKEHRSAI